MAVDAASIVTDVVPQQAPKRRRREELFLGSEGFSFGFGARPSDDAEAEVVDALAATVDDGTAVAAVLAASAALPPLAGRPTGYLSLADVTRHRNASRNAANAFLFLDTAGRFELPASFRADVAAVNNAQSGEIDAEDDGVASDAGVSEAADSDGDGAVSAATPSVSGRSTVYDAASVVGGASSVGARATSMLGAGVVVLRDAHRKNVATVFADARAKYAAEEQRRQAARDARADARAAARSTTTAPEGANIA
jgi:hypothetical protein